MDPEDQNVNEEIRVHSLNRTKETVSVIKSALSADSGIDTDSIPPDSIIKNATNGESAQISSLLRFFESKLFDMSFVIMYLFNSKEPGVQTYLGNRLFSYKNQEVDRYLPQLLNMYIHMIDLAEVIHPYLSQRCKTDVEFSVITAWLLDAYCVESLKPSWKNSQGIKLRDKILNDELKQPKLTRTNTPSNTPTSSISPNSTLTKKHKRSTSEIVKSNHLESPINGLKRTPSTLLAIADAASSCDISSGYAFDSGCSCAYSTEGKRNSLIGKDIICQCWS